MWWRLIMQRKVVSAKQRSIPNHLCFKGRGAPGYIYIYTCVCVCVMLYMQCANTHTLTTLSTAHGDCTLHHKSHFKLNTASWTTWYPAILVSGQDFCGEGHLYNLGFISYIQSCGASDPTIPNSQRESTKKYPPASPCNPGTAFNNWSKSSLESKRIFFSVLKKAGPLAGQPGTLGCQGKLGLLGPQESSRSKIDPSEIWSKKNQGMEDGKIWKYNH